MKLTELTECELQTKVNKGDDTEMSLRARRQTCGGQDDVIAPRMVLQKPGHVVDLRLERNSGQTLC